MGKNWESNITSKERYNVLGITSHMLKHAENSTAHMCVVDVGCSRGTAMRGAQLCLKKHGVSVHTIGIDPSPKVERLAKINVDEFYSMDVLDIDWCAKADVVICANVARFVDGEHKHKILKKCAQLLKPSGVLIVSAGQCGKFKKTMHDSPRPPALCVKNVLARVCASLERLKIGDVFALNKDQSVDFADHVLKEWNDKPMIKRAVHRCAKPLLQLVC